MTNLSLIFYFFKNQDKTIFLSFLNRFFFITRARHTLKCDVEFKINENVKKKKYLVTWNFVQ